MFHCLCFQIMANSIFSPACNNFVGLNNNWKRVIPMTCNNMSLPRVLTTRLSATSRNVFKWANSEDSDISTAEASLSLTPDFILPVERRPNLVEVSKLGDNVPIIDMGTGDADGLVEEIARACEMYGLFLIKNHGVPQELCESMLAGVTDLFHLPPKVKALLVSDDPTEDVRICNHYRKAEEKGDSKAKRFSMWSEVFKHPWHPSDQSFADLLPSDPPNYRYGYICIHKSVM